MNNVQYQSFEGVKGYATYANAYKQGEKVAALIEATTSHSAQSRKRQSWIVMALPTGRFAPCFIYNGDSTAVMIVHENNCCVIS